MFEIFVSHDVVMTRVITRVLTTSPDLILIYTVMIITLLFLVAIRAFAVLARSTLDPKPLPPRFVPFFTRKIWLGKGGAPRTGRGTGKRSLGVITGSWLGRFIFVSILGQGSILNQRVPVLW